MTRLIQPQNRADDFWDQKNRYLAGIKTATDLMVSMHTPERRKCLLVVTDGVDEPPEDSPYFGARRRSKSLCGIARHESGTINGI
jgi:hypothetical protein